MNKKVGILKFGQFNDIFFALKKRSGDEMEFFLLNVDDETLDINDFDGIVLPRGKSLEYSNLLLETRWADFLKKFLLSGKPILTICGSLIVFAKDLGEQCEGRKSLRLVDIRVDNNYLNGFFDVDFVVGHCYQNCHFTDAPKISVLSERVEVLAFYQKDIVAIKDGHIFGYTFFDKTGMAYDDFLDCL